MLYADLSADNECLYAGFTPLSEEVRRNNDMKELMACNTTRLQQMEFITLMRETVEQIEMRGATPIETDALRAFTNYEEVRDKTAELSPLGRMGQPEDLAGACLFLCSSKASWVTGHTFIVDGGTTFK